MQLLPLLTGVQRAMLGMLDHLDRREFEPEVACQAEGPLTEELAQRGIRFHIEPSLVRPIRPLKDLQAIRCLTRFFRSRNFSIVHTHSSKPGVLGRVAAQRAKVPVVLHHVHGFAFHEFSSPWKRWLFQTVEKQAGKLASKVIFVSHEEQKLAIRTGLLPEEKCLTMYYGVDLGHFGGSARDFRRAAMRKRLQIDDATVVIVAVGRLEEQKQPLLLPMIAAQLDRIAPQAKWQIVVAGSGSLQKPLEQRITELRVRHRVQLLGWQHDTRSTYDAGDIMLHTTLWEGLPIALLEAQAAGLPCVVSDIKGNREAISEQSGILCEPRQANDYVRQLAALIADAPRLARMAVAARQRACTEFDANVNYPAVNQLYRALLEQHEPARRPKLAA